MSAVVEVWTTEPLKFNLFYLLLKFSILFTQTLHSTCSTGLTTHTKMHGGLSMDQRWHNSDSGIAIGIDSFYFFKSLTNSLMESESN